MDPATANLRVNLKKAGLSDQAIDAAWPAWWSDDAANSSSARAELRFAVARKLGVSPAALSEDRVEFVWNDAARFKHLSDEGALQRAALASFGVAVGKLIVQAAQHHTPRSIPGAEELRAAMLESSPFVDLSGLLATCWALGVPVVHLRVFPLTTKAMHAMAIRVGDRFAILLGKDAQYPAPVAFTLAHEIGHIGLGHLAESSAIVDLGDPITAGDNSDDEEAQADRFALSVLTGSPAPDIQTNIDRFGGRQLAAAVLDVGPQRRIEPGTLALCYAYRTDNWSRAMSALRYIYGAPKPAWREINEVAAAQLEWNNLPEDSATYLKAVMGMPDV